MKITITRKKKFAGSIIPYYCIINYSPVDFRAYVIKKHYPSIKNPMEDLTYIPDMYRTIHSKFSLEHFLDYINSNNLGDMVKVVKIKNNETKVIESDLRDTSIFVVSFMPSRIYFGNQIDLTEDGKDKICTIETTDNWLRGSKIVISSSTS